MPINLRNKKSLATLASVKLTFFDSRNLEVYGNTYTNKFILTVRVVLRPWSKTTPNNFNETINVFQRNILLKLCRLSCVTAETDADAVCSCGISAPTRYRRLPCWAQLENILNIAQPFIHLGTFWVFMDFWNFPLIRMI